jgi:serine/threonine protein kinase
VKIHITAPCITSGLSVDPAEQPSQYIEVRATPGAGGQGSIYDVVSVDGRRVAGLLVKIFGQGFPPPLKDIVRTIHDHGQSNGVMSCSSLRALPLFLFDGKAPSQGTVQGYVMRRVPGASFYEILNSQAQRYISLPLTARLLLASQFVDGMAALYNLTLVHADLNGQNLMVDMSATELSIIDVDGGAIARNNQVPVVIGKQEPGWLAPEIIRQLATTTNNQQINVDIKADLWSIASGVHYLIFGMQPYFFLHTYGAIPGYLRSHRWPEARNLKGIRVINQHALGFYEAEYRKIPELHDAFRTSFQDGFGSPNRRLSAYQWKQAIKRALLGAGVVIRQAPPPGPTPRPFAPVAPGPVVAQGPPAHVHPAAAAAAAGREWAKGAAGVMAMLLLALGLVFLVPGPSVFPIPPWLSGTDSDNSQPAVSDPTRRGPIETAAPQPVRLSLEQRVRQDPQNVALWSQLLVEWQRQDRRGSNSAIEGIVGVVHLLRHEKSQVDNNVLIAALNNVGQFPRQFYLNLANSAESTGGNATAVAVLRTGVLQLPNDDALRRELDIRQRATPSEESPTPVETDGVHVVAYDTDTIHVVNESPARLTIYAAPSGSNVLVDGKVVGNTSQDGELSVEVPPGTRNVVVQHQGFRDETLSPRMFSGLERRVPARLELVAGRLSIVAPAGATIAIDGMVSGASQEVRAGSHVVTVSKPGFVSFRESIDVPPGENVQREVTLLVADRSFGSSFGTGNVRVPSATGTLAVRSKPDSIVFVDGDRLGAADDAGWLTLNVSPGQHQVVFKRDGFIDDAHDVEIVRGSEERITATLKESPATRRSDPTALGAIALGAIQQQARSISQGSPFRIPIRHDHRSIRIHYLTDGMLTLTADQLSFVSRQFPEDSFSVDWTNVREVKQNGLNKRDGSVVAMELRVARDDGRKLNERTYNLVSSNSFISNGDVLCGDCAQRVPPIIALVSAMRAQSTSQGSQRSAEPAQLDGAYWGQISDASGTRMMVWLLSRSGSTVSGSITGGTADKTLVFNGEISGVLWGNRFTFRMDLRPQGEYVPASCVAVLNGTAQDVTGTVVKGTYSASGTCERVFRGGGFRVVKRQ